MREPTKKVEPRPNFLIGVPLYRTPVERAMETLNSLLGQRGEGDDFNLQVRVVVREPDDGLASALNSLDHPRLTVEADLGRGLYAAVSQALRDQEADYFGYLGGGDIYEPAAMRLVLEASRAVSRSDPLWVTGLIQGRRSDGAVVRSLLPLRYSSRNFENGLHGTVLPTVQQESTLWSRSLNDAIDWDAVSQLRLAGDFLLWKTFTRICEPVIVEAAIGSFTWHGDNRSSDWESYEAELRSISRPSRITERLSARAERLLWGLPAPIKWRVSRQVRRYTWPSGPWR